MRLLKWTDEFQHISFYLYGPKRFLRNSRLDPYSVLGISKGASKQDVKKAYYKLVKEYHPDKNPKNAEKFKSIQNAYQAIQSGTADESTDTHGYSSDYSSSNSSWNTGATNTSQNSRTSRKQDFNDFSYKNYNNWVYRNIGSDFTQSDWNFNFAQNKNQSNFQDFASTFFNTANANIPRQSNEVHDVSVSFIESCLGTQKLINTSFCVKCAGTGKTGYKEVNCFDCDGKGTVNIRQGSLKLTMPCVTCGGFGRVKKVFYCDDCDGVGTYSYPKQYSVSIPAGVTDGQVIKIKSGNTYYNIKVTVAPSSVFSRINDTIYSDLEIDYVQAIIGQEIIVPTIFGDTKIKIPPGTSSHSQIRIPKKGIKGNAHVVNIKVKVPKPSELSSEMMKKLADSKGYKLNDSNQVANADLYGGNYMIDKAYIFLEKLGINIKSIRQFFRSVIKYFSSK